MPATTLGFSDLVKVIEQVKPPIVLPMHYDDPDQAEYFASFLDGRYPVQRQPDSRLVLTRRMLPKSTEFFILPHPNPYAMRRRWGGWDDDR